MEVSRSQNQRNKCKEAVMKQECATTRVVSVISEPEQCETWAVLCMKFVVSYRHGERLTKIQLGQMLDEQLTKPEEEAEEVESVAEDKTFC
jgi:hypothetical protein